MFRGLSYLRLGGDAGFRQLRGAQHLHALQGLLLGQRRLQLRLETCTHSMSNVFDKCQA